MKKILIAVGVVGLGLFFITHKKTSTHAQAHPVYLPEEDVEPAPQKTFQRHVASIKDLQNKLTENNQKVPLNPTAAREDSVKKKAPLAVTRVPAQQMPKAQSPTVAVKASAQKLYDSADLELLHRAAEKAREEGSRVAYVGEVQDLYAFSPNFFETYRDQNGQPALRVRQFHTFDRVSSPNGAAKMLVQREPYPVPSTKDYDLLTRAIMKAIDDGATVVNIASSQIDRSRLMDAIQYARTRGVPVLTVPPPQRN